MKIYTKTGDHGNTSLYDGSRVKKSDVLIELVGNLDELNSYIGVLISLFEREVDFRYSMHIEILREIQHILFEVGSEIANPKIEHRGNYTDMVQELELSIDEIPSQIPVLKSFILPGGSYGSSLTHVARSITRRIERVFVRNNEIYLNESFLILLNRLSDYLFVLARFVNQIEGKRDNL